MSKQQQKIKTNQIIVQIFTLHDSDDVTFILA